MDGHFAIHFLDIDQSFDLAENGRFAFGHLNKIKVVDGTRVCNHI